jgi:hypothetical protein
MACANGGKNGACWYGSAWIGCERIVGCSDVFTKPALYGGIPLFQCAQPGSNNLAGRSIGSGAYQPVNESALLARQADRPFFTG